MSTPHATPTHEIEKRADIQSQPASLNERWAEVQSELGSEIESVPTSGNVSPNMVRTKFLENPIKTSFVLFQNMSENSLESNVEMFSDTSNIVELSTDISNDMRKTIRIPQQL